MKTKLLTLFSLLAMLLVSTAVLADGRPTGIRIGNMRTLGGAGERLDIDVTVTGTDKVYDGFSSEVWIGNTLEDVGSFYQAVWTYNTYYGGTFLYGGTSYVSSAWQFASSSYNVPLPWAIEWGDGAYEGVRRLFGPPGGPWTGTFSHTYEMPGTFNVTVGDAVCCYYDPTVLSGNAISGRTRYVWGVTSTAYIGTFSDVYFGYTSFGVYSAPVILAITATGSIDATTSIPTMNVYGLLAMSFVLVGAGLLVYRKPQQA